MSTVESVSTHARSVGAQDVLPTLLDAIGSRRAWAAAPDCATGS
jgi:hypothetical protein